MSSSGLIYLASPYSSDDPRVANWRWRAVCRAAARMMSQGKFIISPVAHTHPIAQAGNLPYGWDYWQRYDYLLIDACDEVYVLTIDGWDSSIGVGYEVQYAQSTGKPVTYIDEYGREVSVDSELSIKQ